MCLNTLKVLILFVSLRTFAGQKTEQICKPELSEGNHNKLYVNGYASLECVIFTCARVSRIQFEKQGVDNATEWTPVFEGINRTYHFPFDNIGATYTLRERTDYTDLYSHHILYIKRLIVEDQGAWRCVVYSQDNKSTISLSLELVFKPTCKPELSQGTHNKLHAGGHVSLECVIFTCESISRIQYEKQCTNDTAEWMPVFEGVNRTYHFPIDKECGTYSIRNRADYTDFYSHHILYIKRLIVEDQGAWRCVVYDQDNIPTISKAVLLGFKSTCEPELSVGKHNNLQVDGYVSLECVIHTCDSVARIQYEKQGVQNPNDWTPVFEGRNRTFYNPINRGEDEYTLNNRIEYIDFISHHILYINPLMLEDQGAWRCVVYDEENRSMQSLNMDLDYVIPYIVFPVDDYTQSIPVNSTFKLKCTGVGHHPLISWFKDALIIDEDNWSFTFETSCVNNRHCDSILYSRFPQCENVSKYKGIYTCSVQQYNASHSNMSSQMRIDIIDPSFSNKTISVGNCNSVDIHCDAGACVTGETNVSWLLDGRKIGRYEDVFTIDSVDSDNFGIYTKIVKGIPSNCTFTLIHDESSDKTCTSPITIFIIILSVVVCWVLVILLTCFIKHICTKPGRTSQYPDDREYPFVEYSPTKSSTEEGAESSM